MLAIIFINYSTAVFYLTNIPKLQHVQCITILSYKIFQKKKSRKRSYGTSSEVEVTEEFINSFLDSLMI